jgi:hypothetical protein
MLYVLENLIPNVPTEVAEEEVTNEHQHHVDDDEHATCVILASISLELQRQHTNMDAYNLVMEQGLLY